MGLAALLVAACTATATTAVAQAAGPIYYRLVQYPEAGFSGFYAQINAARRSIDMEMYELKDTSAEQDLASATRRGLKVRVLLDRDYSGAHVNASAYAYLRAHGVQVRWAPAHYIFHIKATSFDGRISDVSTANLTAEYYSSTRDAMVIDSDPMQVRAIEQTFAGDWGAAPAGAPRSQTVQAPGLVWSPNTQTGSAETAMVAQITSARHAIAFESEELSDAPVYEALAADARRGVSCRIVMTDSSEWDTAFNAVTRAGCHVHVFPDNESALYVHEKLVLDDPGSSRESLLIGSQNASWYSLHENRELGLMIHTADGGSAVIGGVDTAFQSDYAHSSPWR
ncbi:MAG TPA: phospholipase D-like domain-containing protein [Solirubrobacteraceae bacterium]|nr:phospholipase D-like domain-containing protein [Solirubrobacteraceae bacterium]